MSKSDYNKAPKIKEQDVMSFINEAQPYRNDPNSYNVKEMPWDSAKLGSNKYINVLLPEEYCMKLDYLSKKKRLTKSKICSEAVIAEIDRMLV